MKRRDIIGINAHGEAGTKSNKEYKRLVDEWKPRFWNVVHARKMPQCWIYNGDQSSLFYSKLPDNQYVT